jgi:hypothetical protein
MIKKINRAALLFIVLFCSFTVKAHDKNGTLGDNASATDIFTIGCGENTHQVYFELFASLPKGSPSNLVVSAELLGGKDTITVTDESSADKLKSRSVYVESSSLIILINKNMNGKANFAMQYHCESASGDHTDSEINQIQNQ